MDLHCHLDLYPNALELAHKVNKQCEFTLLVTTSPKAWLETSKKMKYFSIILFVAFLEVFVFITYHRAPVIHTEEYPPQMIPAISGAANSRIELTPIINRTNTMINVVNDV